MSHFVDNAFFAVIHRRQILMIDKPYLENLLAVFWQTQQYTNIDGSNTKLIGDETSLIGDVKKRGKLC